MDKRVFFANAALGRTIVGLFLIFILLFVMVFDAQAVMTTRYAKPDGLVDGECSSWSTACTLQRAIEVAVAGQTIWVAKGVYYPGEQSSDSFFLHYSVAIYGGFIGTETLLSERNWIVNPTVLSGDVDHNDLNKDANDIVTSVADIQGTNADHVVNCGDCNNATLDGFIINAGKSANSGGGVFIYNSSPTLRNLVISANTSVQTGAGLYTDNSPTLTNVAFRGNFVTGPGVGIGGGMASYGGNPELTNVLFSGNTATYGGGFASHGGFPNLINATFSGNNAPNGGSVFIYSDTTTLINSIIWGNSAPIGVNGGTVTVTDSIVQWGYQGNLDVDPLFVNPVLHNSAPTTEGNYHLRLGSPAIDAGNDAVVTETTDLDGNPRSFDVAEVGSNIVDMGAYEWTPHTLTINTDGSGTVTTNPDRIIFGYGEEVTLAATGDTDWAFTNWTGDENTTESPVTLTITKDTNLTAHFIPLYYILNVYTEGNGTISKSPDKTIYVFYEQVTLTATADSGWEFTHWTGDSTSTENIITVTVTKEKSFTAHFIKANYDLFLPLITR